MKLYKNIPWMGQIDGNKRLSQISIPGTHDSATRFCTFTKMARCQHTDIAEQLSAGFRFLDIRLVCKRDRMYLVHSTANCKEADQKTNLSFDRVLDHCYSFLKQNPSETILMSIKKDRGYHMDKFARVLLEQYFAQHPDRWYLKNQTPVLREARGKIILLRRYKVRDYATFTDENGGLNFSVWPDQKSKRQRNGFAFDMETTDRTPTDRPIYVQDRYSFPAAVKWADCVRPVLERQCPPHTWQINFLSTMHGGCPEESAAKINRYFHTYDLRPGSHGIVIFDYGTPELAAKIIRTNWKKQ